MNKILKYFNRFELFLLVFSLLVITVSFYIFDGTNYLAMFASLLGIVALILCAKGNPLGQALIIVFGLIYGYISYTYAYYGEMLTYVGMSTPMAAYALVSWIKNPYEGKHTEVKVNKINRSDVILLFPLTLIVTVAFYFILKYLGTSNLLISTFSVSTSFAAVYLSAKRSPYYAIAYAFNDIVLVILWILASITDTSYVSVVVCFSIFLINDLYGYYNWIKMERSQSKDSQTAS